MIINRQTTYMWKLKIPNNYHSSKEGSREGKKEMMAYNAIIKTKIARGMY